MATLTPNRKVSVKRKEPSPGKNSKEDDIELIKKDMNNGFPMIAISIEGIGNNKQHKIQYTRYRSKRLKEQEEIDYESEEESSENSSSNNNYTEDYYPNDNMKVIMILIINTLDRTRQFQEVERYLQEGVMKVIEIIVKWTNKGETAAIIDFDRNITREDFDNINKQLYKPRVIGIKVKKVQMFFTVQIKKTIFELV